MRFLSRSVQTVALAAVLADSAVALTQLEAILWGSYVDSISPSQSLLWVNFVGHITASDIASGVTFTIQERDPDGNDKIIEVALALDDPQPTIGQEVRGWVDFNVRCRDGALEGMHVAQWSVGWCDPTLGSQARYGNGGHRAVGTSEPELFELVLVDENQVEAPIATAEDRFACAAATTSEPSWEAVPEMVRLARRAHGVPEDFPLWTPGDMEANVDPSGIIRVTFDDTGQQTCGQVQVGVPFLLYVVADAHGTAGCGLTGSEHRIEGMPEGWLYAINGVPGLLVIGNPFDGTGVNMAHPTCLESGNGPTLLYSITVYPTSAVVDHEIRVKARNPPRNPAYSCPLVALCNDRMFPLVCMNGGAAYINPTPANDCDLPIGVRGEDWSKIKGLYR